MVRIMTSRHNTSTAPLMSLFHKLNPLTLNDVFRLEISKLMYNVESYISNILIE